MLKKVNIYIKYLALKPHPEGGYFSEVYRSNEKIKKNSLPKRYSGSRSFATSIYFLLAGNQVSKFHRLKSDEQWHFYDGAAVKIIILNEFGELNTTVLGKNVSKGEVLQTVIKRNNWFAAELKSKKSFCLVGCVVAPGFDFKDFQLASPDELVKKYPQHKKVILRFT